ncbi:MAG: extracellular solute-binding protein [Treponema sp.]|nr:extracellular solute-binding protein [Treponema sp.]MCL2272173.1 extracellular solute-binding protein [Treponema sp.]
MNKKNVIFHLVLAALIMPVIISCSSKEKLYIYNWTYYTPDSVIEKFEDEYNVRVIYDEFASNEDMYAKLSSSRGKRASYDVVFPSKDFVPIMIQQDMLEKIDKTKLSNLGNIDPEVIKIISYDPQMNYSVPYFYGAAGIIVNTARVPNFQRSWAIFGREDLKGRMTMLDDLREVIGGALSFLGYSVNSTVPSQITDAKNLVNNSWKPNLVKFDAEAFGKGYANGEFWVVHGFPEAVYEEIMDNQQLMRDTVFFIPDEGGPSYVDNMCILKGARNVDLAHKFIDFIHRPDIYAEFADIFGLPSTVNVPARSYKKGFSFYTADELLNTELVEDLGPAIDLYNDAWFNSIRAGD